MSLLPGLVTVALDTMPVANWQTLDLDLSVDQVAAFSVRLHPLTPLDELAFRMAWTASILINGIPRLTGNVASVDLQDDRRGGDHTLVGRERAAAAADCDCEDPADMGGLPLPAVAAKLLAPWGLVVKPGPTAAAAIVQDKPFGQRPLEFIRTAAAGAGLVVWTDPTAGIVFIDEPPALLAAAAALPPIRIARIPGFPGNNVKGFSYSDDKSMKMNSCFVSGSIRTDPAARTAGATQQVPAWAQSVPMPIAQPPQDLQLADYRPMVLDASGQSAAQMAVRSTAELNKRRAAAFKITYTLAGWGDRAGVPYGAPRMAEVADATRQIFGTFFVRACKFEANRGDVGTSAKLDLVDPAALAVAGGLTPTARRTAPSVDSRFAKYQGSLQ